jgi:hypothetical protein
MGVPTMSLVPPFLLLLSFSYLTGLMYRRNVPGAALGFCSCLLWSAVFLLVAGSFDIWGISGASMAAGVSSMATIRAVTTSGLSLRAFAEPKTPLEWGLAVMLAIGGVLTLIYQAWTLT